MTKMSIKLCCCLCFTPCIEYKTLQNDSGECNEFYEITIKYFDPTMLITESIDTLNQETTKESRVLCQDCWLHIKDFDDFHQTVLNSRLTFRDCNSEQKSQLDIKLEPEEEIPVDINYKYEGYSDKEGEETDNRDDHENELNPIDEDYRGNTDDDEDDDDDDEEADEKPLIELKRKQTTKENKKNNEKDNADNKEQEEKPTRKRKPRGPNKDKSKISKTEENPVEQKNKYLSKEGQEKAKAANAFIAEWKSTLECDICKETFAMHDMLNVHFKKIHNTRCYVVCCERKFYRRADLVDHIRVHIDPETHKCDICGKRTSNKHYLKMHKKTVHGGEHNYECQECHKTFAQKCNLDRHLLTHVTGSKDFKCEICGRAYVLEIQLKSHIKLVHSDNRVCDQCGKTLPSPGALKYHVKDQHDPTIEKRTFPCDECGTVLKSSTNLKKHKAAYHTDGTTVYVCSICGKVAASERGLINHRKYVHEKERIHKCSYCDKAFKRPKTLVEHIATHTGEDLYQCPHCPRTFKISSKYHEHRKKVHPVEWEENRKNKLEKQKIDFDKVKTQITL